MSEKSIYELELHERIEIRTPYYTLINRVPGGWIYSIKTSDNMTSVFVPFSKEFQP